AIGTVFLRRQRTLAYPLIDLRLFRAPAFSASVATNTFAFFVLFGVFLFMAQYLQLVLGLSPLQAGLWTVPSSLGFMVGSMATPLILRRVRPAFAMAAGLMLGAAGFLVLVGLEGTSGLAVLVTGSVVFSLGLAPVYIIATDLIVASAPPARAGAASAISETGTEFGAALGIAILGSIGAATYRRAMTEAVPDGVSPEAAEAARGTLGGALTAAERLPDQIGAALLGTAREAFAQGLQLTAVTSAIVVTALAILAVVLLRHVRAGGDAGMLPDPDGTAVAGSTGVEKASAAARRRRASGDGSALATQIEE
ncbi:MAG: MFS transporter, partial [Dongiaceae bacterium]